MLNKDKDIELLNPKYKFEMELQQPKAKMRM